MSLVDNWNLLCNTVNTDRRSGEQAFRGLYEELWDSLIKMAKREMKETGINKNCGKDADDFVHETFTNVFRHIKRNQGPIMDEDWRVAAYFRESLHNLIIKPVNSYRLMNYDPADLEQRLEKAHWMAINSKGYEIRDLLHRFKRLYEFCYFLILRKNTHGSREGNRNITYEELKELYPDDYNSIEVGALTVRYQNCKEKLSIFLNKNN